MVATRTKRLRAGRGPVPPLSFRLESLFWAPWGEELSDDAEGLIDAAGKHVTRASSAAVFSCEGHLVTIDLADRDGTWQVSRVEIRAGEGAGIVAAGFRRRLPLPAMVDELKSGYFSALRAEAVKGPEPNAVLRAYFDDRPALIESVSESRRGRTLTDEHFQNVAELYRQRVHFGSRTPNKDLAAELGLSAKTVANWVGEARNRGFLTRPSKPGVAEV